MKSDRYIKITSESDRLESFPKQPDIAQQVRQYLTEIIELADRDALDILNSKVVEQEVLDLIDESETW
ncbi:MAG: hypothetical protein V7K77_33810 [Nostoc sp.]|uniref:hypothetical protein n=1 Tax=Nostoc sp. TaxID=1180 RepID=UPI002FFA37C1